MQAILTFLFIPYIFYGVVVCVLLFSYIVVKDARDDFSWFALFLFALLITGFGFYYPSVGAYIFTIKGAIITTISYIVAGAVVSMWKWMVILIDFRKEAPLVVSKIKENYTDEYPGIANRVSGELYGYHGKVIKNDLTDKYYPNYKGFPIANWWIYWPLFVLQLIFDPIDRIIRHIYNQIKEVYNNVAKRFSV